ncbi:tripartite tricarboxylate transporter substrate binding protein [Salinactinospora qingdaonensis]|uniref:Tripartite tricarboxylate transporter substrate binding protein n=1 Tax=Salinactinospora qingdaonensis TaxID=702744 RepID=A0ABP7GFS0_9ACTN
MTFPTRDKRWRLKAAALAAVGTLLVPACGGGTQEAGTAESSGEAESSYPERPITWMVSFDPGGGSDTQARRVQQQLEEDLGTSIQIEYRSGGGGAVGWAEAAQASADGYTVSGLVIPHILIQPLALEDTGYETEDFRAAAWQVGAPVALLVSEDSQFEDLEGFLQHAEDNPGELTIGGVGNYSASDLALAQLMQSSDVDVSYVPVTGGAGALISDLAGGHIDAAMLGTSHAATSDKVRPLAIGSEDRIDAFPDVPTFTELGHEVNISYAWGVGMPADAPDEAVTRFGEAVITAMEDPEIQEELPDQGFDPIMIGPDEAQSYVDEQKEVYADLLPLLEEMSG